MLKFSTPLFSLQYVMTTTDFVQWFPVGTVETSGEFEVGHPIKWGEAPHFYRLEILW